MIWIIVRLIAVKTCPAKPLSNIIKNSFRLRFRKNKTKTKKIWKPNVPRLLGGSFKWTSGL